MQHSVCLAYAYIAALIKRLHGAVFRSQGLVLVEPYVILAATIAIEVGASLKECLIAAAGIDIMKRLVGIVEQVLESGL